MVSVTRARLRRVAAGAAAAVAAVVIAGGCTAQHGGGAAGAASQAVAGNPAASATRADTPPTPIPATVRNSVRARRAVRLTGCTATKAGGLATGTITATRAATYTITVFLTTSKATVIGYATTSVRATPGKPTHWQAAGHFTAPRGMRCVLRGVTAS